MCASDGSLPVRLCDAVVLLFPRTSAVRRYSIFVLAQAKIVRLPPDRPSNQPPDCPANRPSARSTVRPTDPPTARPSDRLTLRPSVRPPDFFGAGGGRQARLIFCPSNRASVRPTVRPTDRPTDRLCNRPTLPFDMSNFFVRLCLLTCQTSLLDFAF